VKAGRFRDFESRSDLREHLDTLAGSAIRGSRRTHTR
jgi:hypothetical protein